MNLNGSELVNKLVERLFFLDKRSYDTNIVMLLNTLTAKELTELVTTGKIEKWEKEEKVSNNPK